jgi:uncharacterized protein (DUF305 family)
MTVDQQLAAPSSDDAAPDLYTGRRLRLVLMAVLAIATLTIAGTAGWLAGRQHSAASVSNGSVDAGFSRDMSIHHQQAVAMAGYERDHTTNPDLKLLAYNIEDTQSYEIGQMQGWMDSWGLVRSTTRRQMQWMSGHAHLSSAGLMPGMATATQLSKLETQHGRTLDVDFLQLMIHHHQGGIPMEQYAMQHAKKSYVRNLARAMMTIQSDEIIQMEQTLRSLGGSPLPPPAA